jgi:hypothetical protein
MRQDVLPGSELILVEYEESELSAVEMFLLELAGDVMARSGGLSGWGQTLPDRILGSFQRELELFSRATGKLVIESHCWCRIE